MKLDIKFAKTTVPLQIWICPCTYRNYFTLSMVPFMDLPLCLNLSDNLSWSFLPLIVEDSVDELKSLRPLANNALVLLCATSKTFANPVTSQGCGTVASFWRWVASVNRQKRYEGAIFVNTKDRQFLLGRFVLLKNEIKKFRFHGTLR